MADTEKTPLVGIIMGSKSDLPTMEKCTEELETLGVPYELVIASAHRTPDKILGATMPEYRRVIEDMKQEMAEA